MNLSSWIEEIRQLCQPTRVHICDGSKEEFKKLCQELVQKSTFVPVSNRPGSFWCHSHPDDVARVEEDTFICSATPDQAGPTNNWQNPEEMKSKLLTLFKGCMRGRTLYVIPFNLGPLDSPYARMGVQITDSPYVVINMHLMTYMGEKVMKKLDHDFFLPCLHSVGVPLEEGQKDMPWPCNPKKRYIVHFPDEPSIWSFGSGYGGNALLSKKCYALRIASVLGQKQHWLAEHMLIMGITSPKGEKKYLAAAFPSACGKTNLAMLQPKLPGWKVECVGDDIAWMHFGSDGQLYAINPEKGFFGVAPGTSWESNPSAMATIEKNTIFTNVALTPQKEVWWEGMTPTAPAHLTDWLGQPWTPESPKPAAHPNARFTAPIEQCPILDPAWKNPQGVPISAIIFGGRRSSLVPLVTEAFNWAHGVFLGASLSSERTAAAKGTVGELRFDPFAMLPFCGYHMGDYFARWLEMGKRGTRLPRFYQVNWFRKNSAGKYLWPGFSENMRVLKWIFERVSGEGKARSSPIGYLPTELDLEGLNVKEEDLFHIDTKGYFQEAENIEKYFRLFGDKLPAALSEELNALKQRLP